LICLDQSTSKSRKKGKDIRMSTQTEQNPHIQAAQACIEEIRAMRQKIPNFVIPTAKGERRRLINAANVPPEFIELTAVAVKNSAALVRGGGPDPDVFRDLLAFGDAYGPVADELEALAYFVRHSVTSAKNKAGSDALTTYALTQRLAKRPETADLAPQAEAMARALGRRGNRKPKAQPAPAPETPGTAPSPATAPPVSTKSP
jgi:hypothetical protein